MSANGNISGGLQVSRITQLTTTSTVDITRTAKQAFPVADILVTNTGSSAVEVTINYNDGSTDTPVWIQSIAGKTADRVEFPFLVPKAHKLTASLGASGTVTITCAELGSSAYAGL